MAEATLQEILELEELKKETAVTRSVKTATQRVLALDSTEKGHMEELLAKLKQAYNAIVVSVQHCRLVGTRREKLWALFHRFSLENGSDMCKTCDLALNLSAPETFWQLLMEKEFLKSVMLSEQANSSASTSAETLPDSASGGTLTFVEENAVRYTAGYIIRKLEAKYSRQHTHESKECLQTLREMAGKLSTRDTASGSHSNSWTTLTNRGGLYHVEDIVFELFVVLEHVAKKELTSIFNTKGKGLEKVKKEKLSWMCDNEDVKFIWCMVSPTTIENEDARHGLLKEIAHLWLTTRGHSKARRIKENYKMAKGKCTKGKHSLRKELTRCTVHTD